MHCSRWIADPLDLSQAARATSSAQAIARCGLPRATRLVSAAWLRASWRARRGPKRSAFLRGRAAAKGRILGELLAGGIDIGALALEVVGDGASEPRIGDEMRRIGVGRQVAAGEFVLALRPGLDACQPVADGELDGLIVADLEVQAGVVLDRAPVAPIKAIAADQVQGAGDRF